MSAANVQIDQTSQNVDFLKNVSFSATASKLPEIYEELKEAHLEVGEQSFVQ
jgi:hypothetical protein